MFSACSFFSTVSKIICLFLSSMDVPLAGFLFSFILFLTFTNELYVTTSPEKGFRSISFLWPKTAFFVKLACVAMKLAL